MAKQQRRGNREARKPKTAKPSLASAPPLSLFPVKGASTAANALKRKS